MKQRTLKRTDKALLRSRHNKTARGMSATSKRSGHMQGRGSVIAMSPHQKAVLSLNVNGTTDRYHPLMFRVGFENKRGSCPCCGRPHDKLRVLNDKGRAYLVSKRKRRLREGKRLVASLSYRDLVAEHKLFGIDKGDPWGSNLIVLFGVAAELFHRAPESVPTVLEYSPGMATDPREPEDYFYELFERCTTADLQRFALLLNRYDRLLRQAGRDY